MSNLFGSGRRGRRPSTIGNPAPSAGRVHTQCCVLGCKSTRLIGKHAFPKDWRLSKAWTDAIQNPELDNLTCEELRSYRICKHHFSENSYTVTSIRKILRNDAVPQLLLCQPSTHTLETGPSTEMNEESATNINTDLLPQSDIYSLNELNPCSQSNESPFLKTDAAGQDEDVAISITPRTSRKRPLLGLITRKNKLTPVASHLHQLASTLLKRQTKNLKQLHSYKQRLNNTEAFFKSREMTQLRGASKEQLIFLEMQIRNIQKKANARRFSLDEKLLALAILKQSGQCYRLLSRIFILPTPRSLRMFLRRIQLKPGINNVIFEHLKEQGQNMSSEEKICILLWDEVSLTPQLYLDESIEKIIGFEDWGHARTNKIADHALVFMLRGVQKNWIIPLSYNFCKSSTSAAQLTRCIRRIVAQVTKAGFNIVATVCDQSTANVSCINKFSVSEGKIKICGHDIIPLYDPPHLIKGIRNNLLNKEIEIILPMVRPEHSEDKNYNRIKKYLITENLIKILENTLGNVDDIIKGKQKLFASWDILELAYVIDSMLIDLIKRQMPKVTDCHITKNKIPKMRVKVAAQTLSRTMAAFIRLLTRTRGPYLTAQGPKTMPAVEGVTTSVVLQFFNDVFDSVNGSKHGQGNELRTAVTDGSIHMDFWKEAAYCLKRIVRFVNPTTKITKQVPTLRNWVVTLNGFRRLWITLKDLGLKKFYPRNINQDSLENFFGTMRSHGGRNINPTCLQFGNSFKCLLINNLTSAKTVKGNCTDDGSEALFSLRNFATLAQNSKNVESIHVGNDIRNNVDDENNYILFHDLQTIRTGTCINNSHILAKILNINKNRTCCDCVNSTRYFENFNSFCKDAFSILEGNIPFFCFKSEIIQNLKLPLLVMLDYSFISCITHAADLKEEIARIIVVEYLTCWCKFMNRLLKGKDSGATAQSHLSRQAIAQHKKTLFKKNR